MYITRVKQNGKTDNNDDFYRRNINIHIIVVQTQQPAAISQNATKVELIETTEQITSLSVCRIK